METALGKKKKHNRNRVTNGNSPEGKSYRDRIASGNSPEGGNLKRQGNEWKQP